jgi:asparagine synthase (glutamine-hydrolysing)
MGQFLALTWDDSDSLAVEEAGRLASRVARSPEWRRSYGAAHVSVWTAGPVPLPVLAVGQAIVIGRFLRRGQSCRAGAADVLPFASPLAAAERLSRDTWGAYVALIGSGADRCVFRDPSGAMECFTWSMGRVQLTTSQSGPLPPDLLPPRGALNWRAIANWTLARERVAIDMGLDGIQTVAAGSLLQPGPAEGQVQVWNPARIATSARDDRDPGEGLIEAIALATEGLIDPHQRLIDELSGGLDSAIVAATLVDRGYGPRIATCLNYFGDRPEGDERAYARAVADRLQLPLTSVGKAIAPVTESDFTEVSKGLRPAFATIDPARDRDTASRLVAANATALVTGHGGDVVFFQFPTALVAVDRMRQRGLRAMTPAYIAEVARFSRKPAWTVLRQIADQRGAIADYRPPELNAFSPEMEADPWSRSGADLPPAKRIQLAALFRAQLMRGWSRRAAVADVMDPLLAQPVTEFCLALPVPDLVEGGRDRGLARRAFHNRLPSLLTGRRSKGDLTSHYGRVVAASLDFLRPHLLEGCLVAAGLYDRRELETILRPERLILHRASGEILVAAAIESWVRWWQTRVPDSPDAPRPR